MDASPMLKLVTQSPQDLVPLQPGLDKTSARKAAQMFEGLVMTQMLQAMRKTIQPSGLFGDDSQTRSTYEYLLDQAVVEQAMASGKGLGLAERMEKTWEQGKNISSTLS
jgi:Rod binding domain-containing protein